MIDPTTEKSSRYTDQDTQGCYPNANEHREVDGRCCAKNELGKYILTLNGRAEPMVQAWGTKDGWCCDDAASDSMNKCAAPVRRDRNQLKCIQRVLFDLPKILSLCGALPSSWIQNQ